MWSNTKLLIAFTFLIIILGFGFILIGLSSNPLYIPNLPPSAEKQQSQIATSSAIEGVEGERAAVTKVIDGDTIDVEIAGVEHTVRFLGMDTPETVDPKRPVGCFGKEASNETKSLLSGKIVILQKDISETDKYGRLLRFVYLPLADGQILFIEDYLVREGFAKVLTYPPDVKYSKQLREAENWAKENKKGLWGKCL